MMKQSLNEQLMEALAFDPIYKFPQMELVPRWAIAFVRAKVLNSYVKGTEADSIFEDADDARDYFEKVFMKNVDNFNNLESIAFGAQDYSAVLRGTTLHIFKEDKILERNGDVMVEDLPSLDYLLSSVYHSDWRCDASTLEKGFTFKWKWLYSSSERPLVVRSYGD